MNYINLLNFKVKFIFFALTFGGFSNVFAAGAVSVTKPRPILSSLELTLEAEVLNKISESNGRGSYRLSLNLPVGVFPAAGVGSLVKVIVPTIHQREDSAQISSMTKNRADLVLSNQVQQLEGQKLKVNFPVKSINLFKIPFQSIVNPRGLFSEVFTLTADNKVKAVKVTPVQILSDGDVIVSSEHLKNTVIVVQGTDNLISGDSVQVNKVAGEVL
jgi:hypothetical protein